MGGSTSGKGSTTSSSAPPGQAMQSYEGLMHRANALSNQPYNPYTGQLVANLTPQQQQAFSEYGNAYGAAQPYIDQAAAYGSLGASPIQASQIQNYLNPYQQDVIGATEAQMNNIDAAQLAQTQGQGMGAGGLFNDRLGVAQGQVANQQALANNQTLAGLNVQNYSQALAAAQADRAAAAQGAYTFGNLGQENLQSILAGAGANLQAGNAQQQQQQNVLSSNYGQWQQAQAYPYQQIGWAAGIDTGLGSNMGGTSSTQPAAPNPVSQYGGAALTAAGMGYNMYQGQPAFAKRGGAIRGFDAGGAAPYGAGAPWIPQVQITHGSGPPKPPSPPQQQQASGMPKLGGGSGKGSNGVNPIASGTSVGADVAGDAGEMVDATGAAAEGGEFLADMAPALMLLKRGGTVDVGHPRGLEWGHGIRGYADGGAPDDDAPWGATDPEAFSSGFFNPPPVPQRNPLEGGYSLGDVGPGTGFDFNPVRTSGNRADTDPDLTDPDGLHAPIDDGPGAPGKPAGETLLARGTEPPPDNGTAPDGLHRPFEPLPGRQDRAEASLGDIPRVAPPQQSRGNGIGNALMAAGLSLMANRSPYLGSALGEAGLAGLSSYTGEQRHQEQQEHLATKEKLDQEKVDRQLKMLEEQSKRADRTATETQRSHLANEAHQKALEEHQAALLAQGKTPPGYRTSPNGAMEFIPGGPADPMVVARQVKAKVPELTDDDKAMIKRTASLYNIMGPQALTNLGRGAQSGELVKAIKAEASRQDEEQGISPEMRATKMAEYGGLKAGERTAAVAAATVSRAAFEARNMIPQALEAAAKVPRTNWVPINKLIQDWNSGVYSSPAQADFAAANFSLINTYVRAIAPTGVPPDSVRKHAYDMLGSAMSLESYKTVINRMDKEMDAAEKSPRQVVDMFRNLYGGAGGAGLSGNAAPGATTAPSGASPQEGERRQFKQGWGVFHNGQWAPAPAGP